MIDYRNQPAAQERLVAEDLSNHGPADTARINVHETWAVAYWTQHFGVTEAQLRTAVKLVGAAAADVKRHLQWRQSAQLN